jgi:hypothetical protein
MAVREPGGWGLIVRMSPEARAPLRVLRAERPVGWDEDGHLASCNLGGGFNADRCIAMLASSGLLRGTDYVLTAPSSLVEVPGVQGEIPDWLHVQLQSSGNPAELEAKMEPDVRKMWEATRKREYSLNLTPPKR